MGVAPALPRRSYPTATAKPRYTNSVARALAVLEYLGSADESGLGVTEISRRLAVHRSTASRVLATLERAGFVVRDPITEKYFPGERVLELARRVPPKLLLRQVALPYLRSLEERSHETVALAAFQGDEAVTLSIAESRQIVGVRPDIGRPAPAHSTALGKVLLAFQPDAVVARIVQHGLFAYTAHTITDPALLRTELERIRRRGCAFSAEEREIGLVAVAAPVPDSRGEMVAALGISGPKQRLGRRRLEGLAPLVMRAAADLSAWLCSQQTTATVNAAGGK